MQCVIMAVISKNHGNVICIFSICIFPFVGKLNLFVYVACLRIAFCSMIKHFLLVFL